ncbi:MAG TPA: VOC family protein [Tepidisphaeraceae bacterium]|nr:VOC family protein [Tepidisphaeraceae bacterium]
MNKIAPCLWFDSQAEEAATFYTSIFPNSRIGKVSRYGDAAAQAAGRPKGSALTVVFELDGQSFTALNGGPMFRFNEAISLQVNVESQDELDHYWDKLSAGGDPKAQRCGWLKDKFGLSWQIVPTQIARMMTDPDPARSNRVMQALLQMTKLDLRALQQAYEG